MCEFSNKCSWSCYVQSVGKNVEIGRLRVVCLRWSHVFYVLRLVIWCIPMYSITIISMFVCRFVCKEINWNCTIRQYRRIAMQHISLQMRNMNICGMWLCVRCDKVNMCMSTVLWARFIFHSFLNSRSIYIVSLKSNPFARPHQFHRLHFR